MMSASVCLSVCVFACLSTNISLELHTDTHPFNGPLSGTTRVGRYQKGKTNLDFTEARDSEWQWHQLGTSEHRSRQITMPAPHHSVFYGPDALPAAQVSKHWNYPPDIHQMFCTCTLHVTYVCGSVLCWR